MRHQQTDSNYIGDETEEYEDIGADIQSRIQKKIQFGTGSSYISTQGTTVTFSKGSYVSEVQNCPLEFYQGMGGNKDHIKSIKFPKNQAENSAIRISWKDYGSGEGTLPQYPALFGMSKLDNIPELVLITGENGIGKSKLLNFIHMTLNGIHNKQVFYLGAHFNPQDNGSVVSYDESVMAEGRSKSTSASAQEKLIVPKWDLEDPEAMLDHIFTFYKKKELETHKMASRVTLRLPWDEINKILYDSKELKGFEIYVSNEKDHRGFYKWYLTKPKAKDRKRIDFSDLSSGQVMILSAMTWQYLMSEREPDQGIKYVLFDEPDKHFDPKLGKRFLHMVQDIFLKHGVQVFMATHNLATVALAGKMEMHIYIMRQDEHEVCKVEPAQSTRHAISILSNGLLTVVEDINYVLVENKDDARFYSMAYQKFLAASFLEAHATRLLFAPVGVKMVKKETLERLEKAVSSLGAIASAKDIIQQMTVVVNDIKGGNDVGGGCNQVEQRVRITEYEMETNAIGVIAETPKEMEGRHEPEMIWGLLDKDQNRESKGSVYAIDVYSFENYLCMPLNLFYLIKKDAEITVKKRDKHGQEVDRKAQRLAKELSSTVDKISDFIARNKLEELRKLIIQLTSYVINQLIERIDLILTTRKEQNKDKATLPEPAMHLEELRKGLQGKVNPLKLANGLVIEACPAIFFDGISGGGNGHKLLAAIEYLLFRSVKDTMHTRIFGALEKIPTALLPRSLLTIMEGLIISHSHKGQEDQKSKEAGIISSEEASKKEQSADKPAGLKTSNISGKQQRENKDNDSSKPGSDSKDHTLGKSTGAEDYDLISSIGATDEDILDAFILRLDSSQYKEKRYKEKIDNLRNIVNRLYGGTRSVTSDLDNAFNQFHNSNYWLQQPDIGYIGACLYKEHKNFLGVLAPYGMENRLDEFVEALKNHSNVVAIFGTRAHWITFKIQLSTDGENLEVFIKDSLGEKQREDLEIFIATLSDKMQKEATQVHYHQGVEQTEENKVSCGLFSLKNAEIMLQQNLTIETFQKKVFYKPGIDKPSYDQGIANLRKEYAIAYVKGLYESHKRDMEEADEKARILSEYKAANAKTIEKIRQEFDKEIRATIDNKPFEIDIRDKKETISKDEVLNLIECDICTVDRDKGLYRFEIRFSDAKVKDLFRKEPYNIELTPLELNNVKLQMGKYQGLNSHIQIYNQGITSKIQAPMQVTEHRDTTALIMKNAKGVDVVATTLELLGINFIPLKEREELIKLIRSSEGSLEAGLSQAILEEFNKGQDKGPKTQAGAEKEENKEDMGTKEDEKSQRSQGSEAAKRKRNDDSEDTIEKTETELAAKAVKIKEAQEKVTLLKQQLKQAESYLAILRGETAQSIEGGSWAHRVSTGQAYKQKVEDNNMSQVFT